jgi:hypothetical protein
MSPSCLVPTVSPSPLPVPQCAPWPTYPHTAPLYPLRPFLLQTWAHVRPLPASVTERPSLSPSPFALPRSPPNLHTHTPPPLRPPSPFFLFHSSFRPAAIECIEAVPKSASGKILRRVLRGR